MRQVDTCDFCGDTAAGLFEPLPASMPDSPRLALCDGCRDRLASVVDPLLARLEDGASGTVAEPGSGGAPDEGAGRGSTDPGQPASDGSGTTTARSADAPGAGPDDSADEGGVGESRDAGGREKRERRGTPPGYRKVMRFLENRQLPVDRSEAEFLVGEAYDLDEDAVAAVIDHAVQYDRLREVDGQLKR